MDRGERNPKRWRWKGITGTVWLLPSESSSSMESSSRSESSEDAGVAVREDKGELVQLTTSGLLLWGCWALPSVGWVPTCESSLALVA